MAHLAINLVKKRLQHAFGDKAQFQTHGVPTTVEGAAHLAQTDPYDFQWWAVTLAGAVGVDRKKGADKGIDGRIYFHDERAGARSKQIILSVKAGHVTVSQVRDLRGVVEREKATIGVLISFEQPTQPMRAEAASAGFYESPWGKHPRIQLLTVGELLEGKEIDYPQTEGVNRTFKRAPRIRPRDAEQLLAFDE